jgi:RHS repeat-associated protein
MHEHLPEFNLINMNGRVYDPLTAMFFSPDPYLQAPGNWLNYNRYGYCLNNPFLYTDPDGEFFLMAVFLGAMINTAVQGFSGNLEGVGSFWKAMGIGALSGAAGYGAGSLVSGAIQVGGFAGGSLIGATGGAAGGFVGGAGTAWTNGASFRQGLKAGLISGGIGAVTGALMGGTIAGIDAVRSDANFWNGMVDEVGGPNGGGMFLDEEIPSGAKPTTTGELAETKSNPNYGKYGMTRNNGTKPHYGVDYAGEVGDDITAMYDGKVTRIGGSKAYGEHFVRTSSVINGKTYNVDYGHMSSHTVTLKETVSAGKTIVGHMGRLGNLAGTTYPTHVHIAVWRPVNGIQGFVMPWWK